MAPRAEWHVAAFFGVSTAVCGSVRQWRQEEESGNVSSSSMQSPPSISQRCLTSYSRSLSRHSLRSVFQIQRTFNTAAATGRAGTVHCSILIPDAHPPSLPHCTTSYAPFFTDLCSSRTAPSWPWPRRRSLGIVWRKIRYAATT